jgi:hypothetical protein
MGGGGGMPLGSIMGSAGAAAKGSIGLGQLAMGLMMKVKRPKYHIPGGVQEATSMARQMANQTVRPGNDQAVADINKATSNSVGTAKRVAKSSTQLLGAAGDANAQRLRALGQNNAMNANFAYNAKQGLMNSLHTLAGYQEKAFDTNVMAPYQQKAETKAALIGAGLSNFVASQDDWMAAWGGGGGSPSQPGANNVMAAPKSFNAGGGAGGGFNPNFQAQMPQAGSGFYPQGFNKNAFSYLYASQ